LPQKFILLDELDPDEYMDAEIIKQLIVIENNYLENQ